MICISIAQSSHRMALVDMHNAARQCDLLELRLDRFEKAPDISDLLAHKPKPVIMSCRRPQDGGCWQGTEAERLALLRQCIVSRADYVEIELEVADQVRPFPPAQRVISYTNLKETPYQIEDIYREARCKNPDVVKLVTAARTPEEAWPLVQIAARTSLPTVVVGIGKPGVMLAVLGKRIGAPWAYAALEQGMETYPGQATVAQLEQVYRFRDVNAHTRFVGVTGFDTQQRATVAVLNAAFAHLGLATRCLPVQVGDVGVFGKVMNAVRLAGVVVDRANRSRLSELADELEPLARETLAADLLLHRNEAWHGYDTLGRAAVLALEVTLRESQRSERPLQGRTVVLVGTSPAAGSVASAVKHRGGVVVLTSARPQAAEQRALELGCPWLPLADIHDTAPDVLVVCDHEAPAKTTDLSEGPQRLHAGLLRPGTTLMDLTTLPFQSALARKALEHGCPVVSPRRALSEQLQTQVRLFTGRTVPPGCIDEAINAAVGDEE